MGLFDTAINNMSKLALNESGLDIPQVTSAALVDEFKATLDTMPSLNEREMYFDARLVPIRESSRLGKYLIEMEDISRYMMTNDIHNLREAVYRIGSANHLALSEANTALVIDESSVLQEMEDLGMNIGGGNLSDGNIGTHGLLGLHTDPHKFRRFANSREFIDTVCNQYGFPLVKKNYNIGLVKSKRYQDMYSDEDVQMQATPDQQVLNEKPYVKNKFRKPYSESDNNSSSGSANTSSTSSTTSNTDGGPTNRPTSSSSNPSSSSNSSSNNNSSSSNGQCKGSCVTEDASLQYIRDLAYGKYDDQLLDEKYGWHGQSRY